MRGSPSKIGAAAAVMAAVVLSFSVMATIPGCGPAAPEVAKEAQYSPESLAQELSFRYQSLNADAKKATGKARSKSVRTAADRQRGEVDTKGAVGAVTKKQRGAPPSLDELLADIDSKLKLIKGVSRADACKQMIETLASDTKLTPTDKQSLTDHINRLASPS